MKLTINQAKGISRSLERNDLEISEHCLECLEEKDISELNLTTLVCSMCKPSTFKLDHNTIEKLLRLYDDRRNRKA